MISTLMMTAAGATTFSITTDQLVALFACLGLISAFTFLLTDPDSVLCAVLMGITGVSIFVIFATIELKLLLKLQLNGQSHNHDGCLFRRRHACEPDGLLAVKSFIDACDIVLFATFGWPTITSYKISLPQSNDHMGLFSFINSINRRKEGNYHNNYNDDRNYDDDDCFNNARSISCHLMCFSLSCHAGFNH